MFSFLPRVTQMCLSKKLYSQKSLSFPPILTVLSKKNSSQNSKNSLIPSHTHSPPTLTVCSLKKTQSLSHSIPSWSQLRSLTLWSGSVAVRLSHSFPLYSSIAVTFSVVVAPPSRSVSVSAPVSHSHSRSVALPSASLDIHFNSLASLVFVNFSLHLLINCNSFFLVLIECWNDGFCTQRNRASLVFVNFWSIAIHFFLFLLSWNAHKETEFKAVGF